MSFIIDWDNLPPCPDPRELVISPAVCIDGHWQPPPVEPPQGAVPLPGTLPLLIAGIAVMARLRRRRKA